MRMELKTKGSNIIVVSTNRRQCDSTLFCAVNGRLIQGVKDKILGKSKVNKFTNFTAVVIKWQT